MIDPFILNAVAEAAWKAAKPEAEWTRDTTIYPLGEFLIAKDIYRMKVADGKHQYKDLPFADGGNPND